MERNGIFILFFLAIAACTARQQEKPLLPWQESETPADCFDLQQIEQAGELIALTISGPDTYYDYMGRQLGVHYMLAKQFADHLGVRLRIELCRDTAEVFARLQTGDADLAFLRLDADTLTAGWRVGAGKKVLAAALNEWYNPSMMSQAKQMEQELLSRKRIVSRVSAPMLSRGVISHYDGLFKRYSHTIGWDWRLIAAQCYQESTFDPEAESWAGAKGLMQIMPSTADHLGLPRDLMTNPERNVEAAIRLLGELEHSFNYIHDRTERQNFVLASYNGGLYHVQDAQRLSARDGHDDKRWEEVRPYILKLSQPQYYQDSLVRYGYMRGNETADYVDRIRQRYQQYKRSVR